MNGKQRKTRLIPKGEDHMKKKFASILMGGGYRTEHQAVFEVEGCDTYIYTVQDFEAAKELVKRLYAEGFGAIELCGAFGEEKARELIALTEGKLAIGFSVHFPEQDDLFNRFFS